MPALPFLGRSRRERARLARQVEVLTASAAQINLLDDKARGIAETAYKKRNQAWQDESWRYYHELGEIWFAHEVKANIARRIRLVVATQPDRDQPPTPVNESDGALARQAIAELDRLEQSDGGIREIHHDLQLNMDVAGEGYLVGYEDADFGERWGFYSINQVERDDSAPASDGMSPWVILEDPDDRQKRRQLPVDATLIRMWRKDAQWKSRANCAMRALLDRCDELDILSRAIRAMGRSRLAAGMLVVPSEVSTFGPSETRGDQGEGAREENFNQKFLEHLTTPLANESSASAVVPFLMRVGNEFAPNIKLIDFARPWEGQLAAARQELLERIANGLDLPREVLLGMADANHWSAWQIGEDAFNFHHAPSVIANCNTLTSGFLLPALNDPRGELGLFVWYEATELLGHPDMSESADQAHDRYTISDDAHRHYKGFTDEDAPNPDEIAERMLRKAPRMGPPPPGGPLPPAQADDTPIGPPPGGPPEAPAALTPEVLAAAAGTIRQTGKARAAARLGPRLAQADRALRSRLTSQADAAVFRAMERAGARLRRQVGRDAELGARIRQASQHMVAYHLGRAAMEERLNLTTDQLLEGAVEPLELQWHKLVARTQAQVRVDAARFGDFDEGALAAQQDEDRSAGWGLLAQGLLAFAGAKLFSPEESPPTRGEWDDTVSVKPGLVREALARAGGARAIQDPLSGEVAGGVSTGPTALDLFREVGLRTSGYVWAYGDEGSRKTNFDPHLELDGVAFASWHDDALGNAEAWPDGVDHWFPGDHDGCQCSFEPNIEVEGNVEAVEGGAEETKQAPVEPRVSTGGDAVPGGYNGYVAAYDPETDKKIGWIDYQTIDGERQAQIAMVEVDEAYRGQGYATRLLDEMQEALPGYQIDPGYMTAEGQAWWEKVGSRVIANQGDG